MPIANAVYRLNANLPLDLAERLERAAHETGRTRTDIVSEALNAWLREHESQKEADAR